MSLGLPVGAVMVCAERYFMTGRVLTYNKIELR